MSTGAADVVLGKLQLRAGLELARLRINSMVATHCPIIARCNWIGNGRGVQAMGLDREIADWSPPSYILAPLIPTAPDWRAAGG